MENEKKEFNMVKDFMENRLDSFPDENEIEDLIRVALKQHGYENNIGINSARLAENPREQAFHDQWLRENEPLSWINYGHGILQDLFIEPNGLFKGGKMVEEITSRDRIIVATVIQWLGSNCGMCFLGQSLKRFGARIVYDEKSKI